jgi:acetylornithine deacetylase/succinyl-diaminopimelate desuccinylase-like protein
VRAGRLHGLGAADVKLNLLCQYWALRALPPGGFKRPLCVAATFGEESGLLGAQALTKGWRGPKPAFALVGEPSELRLSDRHRGYVVFEWTVPDRPAAHESGVFCEFLAAGRAAHSSTPDLGVNAADTALAALRAWENAGLAPRVTSLSAGTAANQVPAEAALRVALRAAPRPAAGMTLKASKPWLAGAGGCVDWRTLEEGLARVRRALPKGCSFNLGIMRRLAGATEAVFDVRYPPTAAPATVLSLVRRELKGRVRVERNNPALAAPRPSPTWSVVRRALAKAGLSSTPTPKATCTEAGVYSRWGVPAAVWGPGRSVGNIHKPNENVPLRDLDRAVRFYAVLAQEWSLS